MRHIRRRHRLKTLWLLRGRLVTTDLLFVSSEYHLQQGFGSAGKQGKQRIESTVCLGILKCALP